MKIILTGACGHIGSYVSKNIYKIKNIKEIILIDNFDTQRYSSLFNLGKKVKKTFFNIDVSKPNSLNVFKNVDFIIHCASSTNAENSFSNKKEMIRNNIGCIKNIINYCSKRKVKLIHISSTSVYGKQAEIVNEDDKSFLKPQSPYAEIKLLEENLLKKNKNKLKFMSFRFGTIAGVSSGMRFHTAINKFCFNASLNQDILIYKTAYKQYRPYLSIKDAFRVFKFCIEKDIFKNNFYNALSQNLTVEQVVKLIKKYKRNIKTKYISTKIMNQLSYHVDSGKLNKLGLKLKSKIEQDIKETLSLFTFKNNEM
jgi:UDP-glucose 4-epimerase|tara:strand:+ start:1799 stop:2731 length:933 start_codon:yes stop_codon:yes gene_type:complete